MRKRVVLLVMGIAALLAVGAGQAVAGQPGASIHGFKFEDLNRDGVYEQVVEPRVPGVTITLTGDVDGDGDSDLLTQTTNNDGEYWFVNLFPGDYTVREIPPAGWTPTTPTEVTLTVAGGEAWVGEAGLSHGTASVEIVDPSLRFGNVLIPASIHGFKFEDLNRDGVYEQVVEPRVPGVTITLTGDVDGDGDSDLLTQTTNNDGEYWFVNLFPGDYTVREIPPAGWTPTTPTEVTLTVAGGEAWVGEAGLSHGTASVEIVDPSLRFGNVLIPASIHGFKFEDLNRDGVYEQVVEPRVPGVTITLTGDVDGDGDSDLLTQTTNNDGEYWFVNLFPGDYTVREIPPAGWTPTTPTEVTLTVAGGEAWVGEAGLSHGTASVEIVDPSLRFGNVRVLTVEVSKTALPSVVRSWLWSVEKVASHERVVLARKKDGKKDDSHLQRFAKQATVEFRVRASARSVDVAHRVSGVITVSVPADAGGPAEIVDVDDVVSPNLSATVSCEASLPVELDPGESLSCEYVRGLPNGQARENTAMVRARVPGESSTEQQFDSDPVAFNFHRSNTKLAVRGVLDERARVYDSRAGFLGYVSAATQPTVFTYSVLVAPGGLAPLCGRGSLENRALLVAEDTGTEKGASLRIPIEVLCFVSAGSDGGKKSDTGSVDIKPTDPGVSVGKKGRIDGVANTDYPPTGDAILCAPSKKLKRGSKRDPLWAMIGPEGRKTTFFETRLTYRKTLLKKGKSRYFRLTRVYVLAKLNMHAGAPINPTTTKAFKWSDRFLATSTPNSTLGKEKHRAIAKHTKSLKRFNKHARGHKPPNCAPS